MTSLNFDHSTLIVTGLFCKRYVWNWIDVMSRIDQVLPRLFPEMTDLEIDRQWAGLMAFTPDGLPVVDHSESSDNVWYGGGFNGHGMPFGPIIGKLLARTVLSGERATGLSPLAHTRATLGKD